MSYYESPYVSNIPQYVTSDVSEPVPGWGMQPAAAGPARVGVGALPAAKFLAIKTTNVPKKDEGVPYWVWIAGAIAIGGGLSIAVEKGWIFKKKAA